MKISFCTADIPGRSFADYCNTAREYGFDGFEISDPAAERRSHPDSIFREDRQQDCRRKLRNRRLTVSALSCPLPVDDPSVSSETLVRYVEFASQAGVDHVIIKLDGTSGSKYREKISRMLSEAEKNGITVLMETSGRLCRTETAVEEVRGFSSAALGVCWNVRETFFRGCETAETSVKTLGAYISYVRVGDEKDGRGVPVGEGDLPVDKLIVALRSLDYSGFICVGGDNGLSDPDIVLTYFAEFMRKIDGRSDKDRLYLNRAGTGTFPWKKYEIREETFSQVLDKMAETYPDQYAFRYVTLDYTRTYSQFRDDVDRAAAALISLGVKKGHHVAVWATNVPQWFITFWATVKIGAVLVTVNTAYKIHEAEYLLRQSDTHTLVMIESSKDSDYSAIMKKLCPELSGHEKGKPLYSERLPFLRNIVTVGFSLDGCLTWDDFLVRADKIPLERVRMMAASVKPDDVCNMQYTSGTTGFPKGVMLTHRNIVNNGKTIGDRMDLSTADRMMIQVPMFHCFGMVLSMTSMMTHGGTLCPLPYFSPRSSLACVTQEKITCFNGVPTMFIAMFGHPDFPKTDFSHIRTGIMAGSNCPPELMKRASVEMNMKEILSVYGQTESSPGCTMGEVNETLELRTETVGSAFPGIECKIIDPETGADLPDGMNGEFVARGFNIMKGYYKMPEATAQTIDADGWLHTGDICCRTPEGYYRVTGRLKDMIIRGGENIYPREIEEFYLTNPKVRDVQVVGVPDEKYGEEACAWIILHAGQTADAAEMKNYGYGRMARHKVPRYFRFVDEFPMNAAGKILKYKMKEESEKLVASGGLV
ncbi:MAG: AMP-binding protein [Clostridia bacterium]|nr:AMP-binding protein [Clostridia bacterium]